MWLGVVGLGVVRLGVVRLGHAGDNIWMHAVPWPVTCTPHEIVGQCLSLTPVSDTILAVSGTAIALKHRR